MNKDKDKGKEPKKKEYDFDYCTKHNMRYPKGSECPKCKEEREKNNF